jgi:hypothetical protein
LGLYRFLDAVGVVTRDDEYISGTEGGDLGPAGLTVGHLRTALVHLRVQVWDQNVLAKQLERVDAVSAVKRIAERGAA